MKALICPLCSQPLTANAKGLACVSSHQFDRAKEGYFNLLPVQHKHSKEPGDAKEQLQARRQFLHAGFFEPLIDAMCTLIPPTARSLLDIGCGEGYFTAALATHMAAAEIYGIDIAKVGVRMAARKAQADGNQLITYAVASSYALPLANESVDWVTRIYAPSKDEELARVLKPDGRVMIVTPADGHIQYLRTQIYKDVKPYQEAKAPQGFVLDVEQRINFLLDLPAGELSSALLSMTPFAWKISSEIKQRLVADGFRDSADFRISVYRKQ